ncbi:MAG: C45 family autoproteolytic acyltransferase/hydrolase [Bacillota bacterium]
MQSRLPVRIAGSPLEIGRALGRLAHPAMSKVIVHTDAWKKLLKWRGDSALVRRMEATRDLFPDLWQEIHGLSLGLDMDVQDVFLWNCRADLMPDAIASSMSIAVNRLTSRSILYVLQQNGLPGDHVSLVEVNPSGKPVFLGLCHPGCVPGSTIAFTRNGLLQAVNDLPCEWDDDGIPSALIGRAVLGAESLADAIDGVTQCPRSGCAHHILASAHEFIMLSIEAAGAHRSVLPVSSKYMHGNAPVHRATGVVRHEAKDRRQPDYVRVSGFLNSMPDHPADDEVLELFGRLSQGKSCDGPGGVTPLLSEDASAVALVQANEGAIGLRLCLRSQGQVHELNVEWPFAGSQGRPEREA